MRKLGLACDYRRMQDKCNLTSSTREPVFRPVMNAAFVVCIRPNNIYACHVLRTDHVSVYILSLTPP
jgi:hypothetical protein